MQDKDEGLRYAQARSRTSGEEFPMEGIRPFQPWDILALAIEQQQSIACFYRGSLGVRHLPAQDHSLQSM